MTTFSFQETLNYFCEHLDAELPKGDHEKEGVELEINSQNVVMLPTTPQGGASLEILLGLVLRPIPENRLKELMTSNFLGVNTGGCKLSLDEDGVCICLKIETSPSTPPQENWEWLHRLLSIAQSWVKILSSWKEFIPLHTPPEERREKHLGEKV